MSSETNLEAVKKKFESRNLNKVKIRVSFDELYNLFRDSSNTFESIAHRFNVSPQAVWEIYNNYFRELLRVLRDRNREEHIEKRRAAIRSSRALRHEALSRFITEANLHSLAIEEIPKSQRPNDPVKKRLIINGHQCSLHFLQTPRKDPLRLTLYFKLGSSIRVITSVEFLIALTFSENIYRFFIIPSTAVKAVYGHKETFGLYIPDSKTFDPRGPRPFLYYWDYENAWHLLK